MKPPQLAHIDLSQHIHDEATYRERRATLQARLKRLQIACYHNKKSAVILFEGWDAAGKGGAIRRIVEKMDPRSYQVYPIGKPNEQESNEHYLQRFWRKIPAKGNITIFDRSWYGRVLVERIEGFASDQEWQRAYDEIKQFETMLTDSGLVIIKLFLHISQDEQLRRYKSRLDDPLKHWKFTEEDLRNRQHSKRYADAYDDMFSKTHTEASPWNAVAAEHKWFARISVLETICEQLEKTIGTKIPEFSKQELEEARRRLGLI